jgi:DNA polymerase-3 subunit beta
MLDVYCPTEPLVAAFQIADGLAPNNSTKPILSNILLNAEDDHLEILVTDSQVGMRLVLPGLEVAQAGQVIVPARKLYSILKETDSTSIRLQAVGDASSANVHIHLSDGNYRLLAVVGENFPMISKFPEDIPSITLPPAVLSRLFDKTAFAVDHDRNNVVLSGLLFQVVDNQLICTATDGKVLSEARTKEGDFADTGETKIVIPASTVSHLQKIMRGHEVESVAIALITDKQLISIRLALQSGTKIEITSRLVDGIYPTYENALPPSNEHEIGFGRQALSAAVRRTALLAQGNTKAIIAEVEKDQAVFSNMTSVAGSATIPIQCSYDGPALRIGLNSKYLKEVLDHLGGDDFVLGYNGSGRGMIIRQGDEQVFLIMPINVDR